MRQKPRKPYAASHWLSAALAMLTILVFVQVVSFDFINIDDNAYVTRNSVVQQGLTPEGIVWAFSTTEYAGFWQPLVWLSLMLDVELFGSWAGGFHLTNVMLHTANTILLFRWLTSLTGSLGKSFFVAAFFAVHPLHVESVAWITERKDVLSTFFGLLSLAAWLKYVRADRRRWYAVSWLAMLASLMSKPMLVTLPFVFLLLDFWPLGRGRQLAKVNVDQAIGKQSRTSLVIEKFPFFALTVAFSVTAFLAQSDIGATRLLSDVGLLDRLTNALVAYATYVQKTFWPGGFAIFYPHPRGAIPFATILWSAALLASVSVVACLQHRKRPQLLVGWLWYLGTLVPTIGIIQVGHQQMADRFTYFPLIGLFLGFIWIIPPRKPNARLPIFLGIMALSCCGVLSFRQTQYWKNSVSVCLHGLSVTENNWFLNATLGAAVLTTPQDAQSLLRGQESHLHLAERHLREAIRIESNYAPAHLNLGLLLSDYGELEQANDSFLDALEINPGYYKAQYYLCMNLRRMGNDQEFEKQRRRLKKLEAGERQH